MAYSDLFTWWASTISAGTLFLVAVSVYLYLGSKRKRESNEKTSLVTTGRHFIFVWVLLGLLVLYVVSINGGSSLLFAAGNILVEAILILYVVKNKTKLEQQTQ
ncbi:hypothetical protein MUP05_06490 [Candidatus Bathyarchaeota archaeon]|nr:hypothetical protein [Candidatus Bathyarchaeota archaeon]